MTVPPPFATTPPSGLPDLIEHDACALAAFATRDGKPSRRMVELALTSLQMMVHRSGSVDGEGDGSGLLVDLPRGLWRRRLEENGVDPAAADDSRFTVAHIFFDNDEHAQTQVPRVEAVLLEHGFEVIVERRGGHRPRRPGAARIGDAADLLADRLPGLRARRGGLQQLLPGDGPAGARAGLPRRVVLGERRRLQGPGAARGHPALLPRDGRPRLHLVADHRAQPLLHEHLPHLQPGPALLDPRPQRRDQHDRPAARAERAARPADHPRRIGQPGPQPPPRGAHLREGPVPARGGRVRPAAHPRRGPPPAGQAPGPVRPLPRGARAPTPRARSDWPAAPRTRWCSRSTPWACARCGGWRPRTSTWSRPSPAWCRSPT